MMTLLGPKLKKKPRQFPDGVKVEERGEKYRAKR